MPRVRFTFPVTDEVEFHHIFSKSIPLPARGACICLFVKQRASRNPNSWRLLRVNPQNLIWALKRDPNSLTGNFNVNGVTAKGNRFNCLIRLWVNAHQDYIFWRPSPGPRIVAGHPNAAQTSRHIPRRMTDWNWLTDDLIRLMVNPRRS
jgi:hypothetical protein